MYMYLEYMWVNLGVIFVLDVSYSFMIHIYVRYTVSLTYLFSISLVALSMYLYGKMCLNFTKFYLFIYLV